MQVKELRELLKNLDADDAEVYVGGSHGEQHFVIESAYLSRYSCGEGDNSLVLSYDPTAYDYKPLTDAEKGKV